MKAKLLLLAACILVSLLFFTFTLCSADDGAGNPFMMDTEGKVMIFYHDSGESEVLAQSLVQFIDDTFEPW